MNWWPFQKRRTRLPEQLHQLMGSGLEYKPFATDDVSIKLWLPEKLIDKLDELAAYFQESRPNLIRFLLFVHVYGRYEFECMRSEHAGLFTPADIPAVLRRKESDKGDLESGEVAPTRRDVQLMLGKSDADFKLWLPSALKTELEELANRAGMKLSAYLRKILVEVLFGAKLMAEWQALLEQTDPTAE